MRLGEAKNPGPAAHKRDVAEEPCARRPRINEARDAAPRSQDSTKWRVQNLQLTDTAAAQPTRSQSPRHRCPTPESATIATPARLLSLRSMRFLPQILVLCSTWRAQTRKSVVGTRKRCSALTTRSGSLRILWHHSIATEQSSKSC